MRTHLSRFVSWTGFDFCLANPLPWFDRTSPHRCSSGSQYWGSLHFPQPALLSKSIRLASDGRGVLGGFAGSSGFSWS